MVIKREGETDKYSSILSSLPVSLSKQEVILYFNDLGLMNDGDPRDSLMQADVFWDDCLQRQLIKKVVDARGNETYINERGFTDKADKTIPPRESSREETAERERWETSLSLLPDEFGQADISGILGIYVDCGFDYKMVLPGSRYNERQLDNDPLIAGWLKYGMIRDIGNGRYAKIKNEVNQ